VNALAAGLLSPVVVQLVHMADSLTHVLLQGNALQGEIPAEQLLRLSNLERLELDDNKLTGPVPTAVGVSE
jgi:hypothetical protein